MSKTEFLLTISIQYQAHSRLDLLLDLMWVLTLKSEIPCNLMTDRGTAYKFFFLLVKDEKIDEDCINLSVVYCKYESYEKNMFE